MERKRSPILGGLGLAGPPRANLEEEEEEEEEVEEQEQVGQEAESATISSASKARLTEQKPIEQENYFWAPGT